MGNRLIEYLPGQLGVWLYAPLGFPQVSTKVVLSDEVHVLRLVRAYLVRAYTASGLDYLSDTSGDQGGII